MSITVVLEQMCIIMISVPPKNAVRRYLQTAFRPDCQHHKSCRTDLLGFRRFSESTASDIGA